MKSILRYWSQYFTPESLRVGFCILPSSLLSPIHSWMRLYCESQAQCICIWNKRIPEKNVRRRKHKKYVWGNNLLSSRFIFIWINSQILCASTVKNVPEKHSYGASSYLFLHLTSHSSSFLPPLNVMRFVSHSYRIFLAMTFECSSSRDCIDLFSFPNDPKKKESTLKILCFCVCSSLLIYMYSDKILFFFNFVSFIYSL